MEVKSKPHYNKWVSILYDYRPSIAQHETKIIIYKARFRRRTFHARNLMQELSATLERRLNQLSSAGFD
jgi:UDP-N-acetylenolpyruvoylglucosamine reductase